MDEWKHRDVTLKGKSLVFNCLIGSGLAYYGFVLSCPREYINHMERIKWSFYWDGNIDKIKRSTVCSPKKGGSGIIDIKLKLQGLKINALRKFIHRESHFVSLNNKPFKIIIIKQEKHS